MIKSWSYAIKKITDAVLILALIMAGIAAVVTLCAFIYRDHGALGLIGSVVGFAIIMNWLIWSGADEWH